MLPVQDSQPRENEMLRRNARREMQGRMGAEAEIKKEKEEWGQAGWHSRGGGRRMRENNMER